MDCICEGERMLYIHPDECVDCRACEPACLVEAIYYDLPDKRQVCVGENARFFAEPLPGRDEPLGSPGGAGKTGAGGRRHPVGRRAPATGIAGARQSATMRRSLLGR